MRSSSLLVSAFAIAVICVACSGAPPATPAPLPSPTPSLTSRLSPGQGPGEGPNATREPVEADEPASSPTRVPSTATAGPLPAAPVSKATATDTPTATAVPIASPTPTATAEPLPLTSTPLSGSAWSSAVAVSPDGLVVAAVNPDSDSVTLVDAQTLDLLGEIEVGRDPRTLAFTPDSRLLLVTGHRSDTVSVLDIERRRAVVKIPVGPMPYGVVTDGRYAWVAEFASGDVAMIDLAALAVVRRTRVGSFPAGLALNVGPEANGPDILLVTHFFTGEVTALDPRVLAAGRTAAPGGGANLSQAVAIHPDGQTAYLPQTRSNATNTNLTFDTTVFPVVNAFGLVPLESLAAQRITLDTADEPVNMPFGVVFSPDGERIFVVNAGSDDLSVIDLATGRSVAHLPLGANPRGIAMAPDGSRLFANNVLDGTLTVVDAEDMQIESTVLITRIPLETDVLVGKRIFNSAEAPVLTTDNWISCATCHFDGGADSRTWLGFPDGPRNTPPLFGVGDTLPIHWSGDLDELQDVEITIRKIQSGTGLVDGEAYDSLGSPHAGLSDELDALAAYMESIEIPTPPHRPDEETTRRGEALFESAGCESCHMPHLFTDQTLHDVGTGDLALEKNSHGRGTSFDTPALYGLWLTAPYFHDGSAATLDDVLRTGPAHDIFDTVAADEVADLVDYLLTLAPVP